MKSPTLFMLVLGCKPAGRTTEQHDVFFGIAGELKDLVPAIIESWPEAKGRIHIDAWRKVTHVEGYDISIIPRSQSSITPQQPAKLFFINLGGYKKEDLEEYHYKVIVAAADKGVAVQRSKETAFYKHMGFKGATSHIDDKYGIDVDDLYEIADILPGAMKEEYTIMLTAAEDGVEDEKYQGYFKLDKL